MDQVAPDPDLPTATVDELRLDPLVDSYSDKFFPWITVLMKEPKYFILAPAIVQAVVNYLRDQGAPSWERNRIIREARLELRFAEACLCRSLKALAKKGVSIIGIEKINEITTKGKITRRDVTGHRGVAKTINMHMTPRYLARTARLFRAPYETSALELIVEAAGAEGGYHFWWDDHELGDYVSGYAAVIQEWLEGGDQKPIITIDLSVNEAELLEEVLFGFAEEDEEAQAYHQRLLQQTCELIAPLEKNANPWRASKILGRLARRAEGQVRKDLLASSRICKAVGLIRLAFNSLLAGKESDPQILRQLNDLKKIPLPDHQVARSHYAHDALEFILECQRQAANSHLQLFSAIEERESKVKPGRQKLYWKGDKITAKRKHMLDNFSGEIQEPIFRLPNVHFMVSRISAKANP